MGLKLQNCSVGFVKHACVLVSFKGITVYFDPWKLPENPPKADMVLVSHEHYDHLSPESIKKISKPETVIVSNSKSASKLSGKAKIIEVGDSIEILGLEISTVQAYNIGKPFHPKGLGQGYVVSFGSEKLYHAGDTDFIPEMKSLKGISCAFLPIGGTYTMNIKEAAQAANSFFPEIVVPIHYNVVEGTRADPQMFSSLVPKKTKVEILYR